MWLKHLFLNMSEWAQLLYWISSFLGFLCGALISFVMSDQSDMARNFAWSKWLLSNYLFCVALPPALHCQDLAFGLVCPPTSVSYFPGLPAIEYFFPFLVCALLPLHSPLRFPFSPPYFRRHKIFQKRLYRFLVCQQIGDSSFFGSALPSYTQSFEFFFKNSSLSPLFPTFGVQVMYWLFCSLAPPAFRRFRYSFGLYCLWLLPFFLVLMPLLYQLSAAQSDPGNGFEFGFIRTMGYFGDWLAYSRGFCRRRRWRKTIEQGVGNRVAAFSMYGTLDSPFVGIAITGETSYLKPELH